MTQNHCLAGVPQGFGMYAGRSGLSNARARQLARHHVRHVGVCVEAVDGWLATPKQLSELAAVCRDNGLVPHPYSFPGLTRARQPEAVARMLIGSLRELGGVCPIPDLEAPYRGQPELLVALLDAIAAIATDDELEAMMVTTFGLPSDREERWPWDELHTWVTSRRERLAHQSSLQMRWLVGSMGWQCYIRAGSVGRVRSGIAELAQTWDRARVIPHIATFRRRSETSPPLEGFDGGRRLLGDLQRACLDDSGVCDVPGVWLWWAASTAREELLVIRDFAERVGWA